MNKKFVPGKTYIPASSPYIDEDEWDELEIIKRRGWITEGHACNEFKDKLMDFTGQGFVELCNSGSSADLLAVAALSPFTERNKYVVTCAVGFPTTLTAIYHNNLIPLFIDIDPKTFSPSMGHLQYVMEKPEYRDNIVGAILTHNLGFPFDERLAKEILGDRWLVADCCDALGARVYGNHVGHYADVSTYSFFPAHHITTGEGGAVCTNHPEIYAKIRSLNNWGRDCYCLPGQQNVCGKRFEHEWEHLPKGWDHKYTFTDVGYNLKMTEFQAAFGVAQMDKIETFIHYRKSSDGYLWDKIKKYDDYIFHTNFSMWADPSPFGFPITVTTDKFTAQELIEFLEQHKIATRRMFGGNLIRQPAFHNLPSASCVFEGADYVMERSFWIGCHPGITSKMIDYIGEVFDKWFQKYV